jgi:glutathione synthase/RimK-type ligase-like ATP-grasp enzyme
MTRKPFLRIASSKWNKYQRIKQIERLACYQPDTRVYTKEQLPLFLKRYPTVFIKPDRGYGGSGVICLQRRGDKLTALDRSGIRKFSYWREADRWVKSIHGTRRLLIQQGVSLLPLGGRPVDIRTIVQKNRRGVWAVTGMFAKVAKKGKAVTNVKAGGSVISVPRYLVGVGLKANQRVTTLRRLNRLSIDISKAMANSYRNTLFALDIGIDQRLRPWLIEINTHPSLRVLLKISRRMYLRTVRYRR